LGAVPQTPSGHSSPRIEDPRFTAGEGRDLRLAGIHNRNGNKLAAVGTKER
jgi:hypothetical protein